MPKKKTVNLHCGACLLKFFSFEKLNKHILICPEAKLLYPIVMKCAFGGDKTGHPLSHFIECFHKAVKNNLIKRYAYSIADGLNTIERARIHEELCEILDFPYKEFRPFESSAITSLMNREESLKYLLEEIYDYAYELK